MFENLAEKVRSVDPGLVKKAGIGLGVVVATVAVAVILKSVATNLGDLDMDLTNGDFQPDIPSQG